MDTNVYSQYATAEVDTECDTGNLNGPIFNGSPPIKKTDLSKYDIFVQISNRFDNMAGMSGFQIPFKIQTICKPRNLELFGF